MIRLWVLAYYHFSPNVYSSNSEVCNDNITNPFTIRLAITNYLPSINIGLLLSTVAVFFNWNPPSLMEPSKFLRLESPELTNKDIRSGLVMC